MALSGWQWKAPETLTIRRKNSARQNAEILLRCTLKQLSVSASICPSFPGNVDIPHSCVYLSVCLSVPHFQEMLTLHFQASICQCVYLSVHLSVSHFQELLTYHTQAYICQCIYLSVRLSVSASICLSFSGNVDIPHSSVYLSVHQSVSHFQEMLT